MIDFSAIEEAVAGVRWVNVAPVHIHVRAETFRELIAMFMPEETWGHVHLIWVCGLLVVANEAGLDGWDFALCFTVPLNGPMADTRRGAE